MIHNNIDFLITLVKHTRFDKMLKYKIKKYFQIDSKDVFLTAKFIKKIKFKSLIKRIMQTLLYIIATFEIIITSPIKIKHHINVTIYNDTFII